MIAGAAFAPFNANLLLRIKNYEKQVSDAIEEEEIKKLILELVKKLELEEKYNAPPKKFTISTCFGRINKTSPVHAYEALLRMLRDAYSCNDMKFMKSLSEEEVTQQFVQRFDITNYVEI